MQDLGIYLTQPGASHAPVLDGAASFDHFRKPQVNTAICFLCAALRALSASQFHELARDIELWAGRLQHEESTFATHFGELCAVAVYSSCFAAQEWDRIHLHPQSRERES